MPRVVPSQVVKLIDQVFSTIKDETQDKPVLTLEAAHAPHVSGIVDLASQIPPELLPPEAACHAEFVVSLAALRTAIGMWAGQGSSFTLRKLPAFRYSPVFLIRRALLDLPDEVPPLGTEGLDFIDDNTLRQALRTDIGAATSALRNGEWKAATVLAGSVIEALLLWALTGYSAEEREAAMNRAVQSRALSRLRKDDPENWHLPEYIEVAGELRCISEGTTIEARRTKEYRNLIHPGATARTGQQCDLGTAHIAVGTIDHVVRDLAGRRAPH